MILVKGFNRLQFQYYRVLHDKVETVAAHRLILIIKIDFLFALDLQSAIQKFDLKRIMVGAFKKARTKSSMYRNHTFDNNLGQSVCTPIFQHLPSSPLFIPISPYT